jgi:hypothetical protein
MIPIFRKIKKLFGLLISIIAVLFIAQWIVSSEAQEMKGLKVTVLLFSGRPDPFYILDDEDTIEKLKSLAGNAKAYDKFEKPTVIPSILGYKGVIVENQTKVPSIPAFLAVYKGNIEVKNETKMFLIDEGSAIENLLLQQAMEKGVIPEGVIKRMKLSP